VKDQQKPTFLIAGAQKCGTSSLHAYMAQCEGVYCSAPKELHYFDDGYLTPTQNAYLNHFALTNCPIRGESTPIYMCYPGVAQRIRQQLGAVKVIFICRDPVARAYSHYWHEVKLGWEGRTFEQAIEQELQLLQQADSLLQLDEDYLRHYSYLYRGLYDFHISTFTAALGQDCVKVIEFEQLVKQPQAITRECLTFVGADPAKLAELQSEPRNKSKLPLWPAYNRIAGRAEKLFGPDNLLSRLIKKSNLVERKYPAMSHSQKHLAEEALRQIAALPLFKLAGQT
jgi:hypothetical protein